MPAITFGATFSHTNKKVIKSIQKSQLNIGFFEYTTHQFYYQSRIFCTKNEHLSALILLEKIFA